MELVLHVFLHFRRTGYTLSYQIIVDQVASFPWTTIPYFFFKSVSLKYILQQMTKWCTF